MTCISWFLWVRHSGAVQPCGLGLGPLVRLPSEDGCGLGHVEGLFAHASGVGRRPWYSWGLAQRGLLGHPSPLPCRLSMLALQHGGIRVTRLLCWLRALKVCVTREKELEADVLWVV